MKATSFQIVVAERYPLFRLALRQIFLPAPESYEVSFLNDLHQLDIQPTAQHGVQVLILDCGLVEEDICARCKVIKKQFPFLRIILLRDHAEGISIKKCFQQNIDGFLLKTVEPDELLAALRSVAKGEPYIQHSMRMTVLDWLLPRPAKTERCKLTEREQEILRLIVDEYTSKEIATKLFISTCTVETHRLNLIQKLGVKNTAGLVREALHRNIYRQVQERS